MTDKTCPFNQGFDMGSNHATYVNHQLKKCRGKGCQLWVKLAKDRLIVTAEHPFRNTVDTEYEYTYEGCGLVREIPWILVKKE